MRNRALHDALREFALEAAALLVEDQKNGAELPFEVIDERRRGGPALYRYVPLTTDFIGERWHRLTGLPTFGAACAALGEGAAGYLRANGIPGDDSEPALRAMLERIYEDATGFGFPEERFESVYGEVESTLYRDSTRARVIAPLRGVQIQATRVELGDGLMLVRADCFDGPFQAVDDAATLCVLERDTMPGDSPLASEAAVRFRLLVFGLRLYKAGAVGLGPLGWTVSEGGRWQAVELDPTGTGRGDVWALPEGEEAELREFLGAAWRSTHGGAVAWALSRFEMGCSRELDAEALSDYLLALRALLDAHTEAGLASLSLRLAALCAEEHERRAVQRRVELALALERYVMAGGRDEDYVDSIGSESPRMLVTEMERHLRALLRDVICGYLDTDLKGIADDILLKVPEPTPPERREQITEELEAVESATVRARRITRPPGRRHFSPAAQSLFGATAGEVFAQEAYERARAAETVAVAEAEEVAEVPEAEPPEPHPAEPEPEPELPEAEPPEPDPEPEPEPEPDEGDPVGVLDGVTPSADWDDYSAPV